MADDDYDDYGGRRLWQHNKMRPRKTLNHQFSRLKSHTHTYICVTLHHITASMCVLAFVCVITGTCICSLLLLLVVLVCVCTQRNCMNISLMGYFIHRNVIIYLWYVGVGGRCTKQHKCSTITTTTIRTQRH